MVKVEEVVDYDDDDDVYGVVMVKENMYDNKLM